jgi:hypothetical protein
MQVVKISRALAAALAIVFLAMPFGAQAGSKVVAAGKFVGASDHVTTGGVSIIKTDSGTIVVLEPDFDFDGAPDPKLGFGKNGTYDPNSKIAHLGSDKGYQIYSVPASIDPGSYNEFYVWCEKYSVPLGVAALK